MWNVKANVIPGITGATNHLRIIQAVSEQQSGKTRNNGTTENSHIGNCTHTSEITNVKVQDIFNQRNNITCGTNCQYITAATLSTLETGLFQVYRIIVNTVHKCDNTFYNNVVQCCLCT